MYKKIEEVSFEIPALRAVLITAMPDCLLFDSWSKEGETLEQESAAAYFGDLVRANRAGLKSMNTSIENMQVTIEAKESLVILRELRDNFVLALVFEHGTPLGVIRLFVKRIVNIVESSLPKVQVEEKPKGVRIVDFLQRYAPDPHAVLRRVSLRSGIPLPSLQSPATLTEDQVVSLENVAREVLGVEQIHV